jgi:predicted nucleotidyltransferase
MLPKPFREFIELLEKNQVRYLIIGGYAVSVHGYPRYTGDLDIFIAIDADNSRGILKTFRDFGFTDLEMEESDFLETDTIVEIGREPLKIQVMNEISGVSFEEAETAKIMVSVDGMKVPFISLEMLIKNKLSTKRDKDRIDAEILRKRNQ